MPDNLHFDMNGEGREHFGLAMQAAFAGSHHQARFYSFHCHPEFREGMPAFVLFWSKPESLKEYVGEGRMLQFEVERLPYEMGATSATEVAWGWLESLNEKGSVPPWKPGIWSEVSSHVGWRIWNDQWGHVDGFGHYSFLAVAPEWMLSGK